MELRPIEIPRGPIIELLERELGRPLTNDYRHYLAGEPVHCGEILELYHDDGRWILGRYEWSAHADDLPTFESEDGVFRLGRNQLLRRPR